MSTALKTAEIVATIDAYRLAYWTHRDIRFVKDKKYKPLVSYNYSTVTVISKTFAVALYDTWIEIDKPGRFYLGKDLVSGTIFYSENLHHSLEKLLKFVRLQFEDDILFSQIKS